MQDAETRQGAHGGTTAMIAFGVFFFSGMAGLIYQVVWSRMLTLVLGVSIYAITMVQWLPTATLSTIPHYIGSGFGFYLNTYPLGPEGYDHHTEVRAKIAEYASWQDPISLIVPDPGQAKRVGQVLARECGQR